MHLNRKSTVGFIVLLVLLLSVSVLILPLIMNSPVQSAKAEPASNYWVTLNSTTPDSPMYTSVGQNWTISFQAQWNYGSNSGQAIENATVTIQVTSTISNKTITALQVNTTSGIFSFNYSSLTADILTFNATKLVTQEGIEYNSNSLDPETGLCGLQSESVTVWWDTFHVSLVSYDTDTFRTVVVAVNVTYLLLPEEGLTLPEWATYSHQSFLPKIVHGKNVTINGIEAKETATAGIYKANVSIWFPTAYIHVAVSQENWTTTHTGFSVTHNANEPIWTYAIAFSGVFVSIALLARFILFKKPNDTGFFKRQNFPFFAGISLAIASVISLYWGIVGIDSTLRGFDWIVIALIEIVVFIFGSSAAIMMIKKKNQAFTIFAVCAPLVANVVIVKASHDAYQLTTPWLIIVLSLIMAIISGILISNSDEEFH